MKTIEKIIGENIARLRNEKGWSQKELAKASKVSIQTISILENGKRRAQRPNLIAIADALGCSESAIAGTEVASRSDQIIEIISKLPSAPDRALKSINRLLQKYASTAAKHERNA